MDKDIILDVIRATNIYSNICEESLIDIYDFYKDIPNSGEIIAKWLVDKDYASPEINNEEYICLGAIDTIWEVMVNESELIYVDKILNDVDVEEYISLDGPDEMSMLILLLMAAENPTFMESLKLNLFGEELDYLRNSIDKDEEMDEYIELMDSIQKRL